MVGQIDRAQAMLADPLAQLLDLGRKSSALSTQVQKGVADGRQPGRRPGPAAGERWTRRRCGRRVRDADAQEPVAAGLRRSLEIETAFAADYDAAHARLLPLLGGVALLLLPLMFWLRRARAQAAGRRRQLGEHALQALARPWAAWLLLVAAMARAVRACRAPTCASSW